MTITIKTPWPVREANPNIRAHWSVKNKAKQRETGAGYNYACLMKAPRYKGKFKGRLPVTITLTPPNRRGDQDNKIAMLKGQIDGIAQYINVDDRHWDMIFKFTEPEKPGCVTYEFPPPDEAINLINGKGE